MDILRSRLGFITYERRAMGESNNNNNNNIYIFIIFIESKYRCKMGVS